jgi:hypothetical protein
MNRRGGIARRRLQRRAMGLPGTSSTWRSVKVCWYAVRFWQQWCHPDAQRWSATIRYGSPRMARRECGREVDLYDGDENSGWLLGRRMEGKSTERATQVEGATERIVIFFRDGKRGGRECGWDCKVTFFKKMEIIFRLTQPLNCYNLQVFSNDYAHQNLLFYFHSWTANMYIAKIYYFTFIRERQICT